MKRLLGRILLTGILLLITSGLAAAFPKKGQPAPPFQVTALSGAQVSTASLQGKVYLVEFFATWCNPCQESIPSLVRLHRKYGSQGFQIIGLSIEEDGQREVRDFIREKKISYPMALAGEKLQLSYGVRSVPAMFLVNRKGQVIERYLGFSDDHEQALDAAIRKALAEK